MNMFYFVRTLFSKLDLKYLRVLINVLGLNKTRIYINDNHLHL